MKNTKIILIANDAYNRNIIYARLYKLRDKLSTRMSSSNNTYCWHVYFGKTVQISIYLKEYRYMEGLHCDYFAIATFDMDYAEQWRRQLSPHGKELTSFDAIKEKITELISYENWELKPYGEEKKEGITIMSDIVKRYLSDDIEATATLYRVRNGEGITVLKTLVPTIKNVIFNDPATIVFWADGTKTVVKAQDGDIFDPEKGLTMAITKKALGNKGNYCDELKKWLPEEDAPMPPFTMDDLKAGVDKLRKTLANKLRVPEKIFEETKYNPVQKAYDILVGWRDGKVPVSKEISDNMPEIDEIIGYLGEALDD